ncbi:MAG: hypothetical protein UU59_C0031G0002 [candidate division WWE3 bacterium GW2011_GWE1_41_27]|uniref:Uncharacterized protein n=2 Tax=Katanobacteria TaxID=422282 RepID=A0A0G1DBI1_UNCKA|nr:MAG: hypothetical protein UU59_C0031G0002 [candidate division WWE3 bacterium GW2011_GWE1_41_27]KKS59533.1 MAG: hypothetical protein UV26_C0021G0010 [candidate division WWE3 bacterium GW2011_GWF2_42_42]
MITQVPREKHPFSLSDLIKEVNRKVLERDKELGEKASNNKNHQIQGMSHTALRN